MNAWSKSAQARTDPRATAGPDLRSEFEAKFKHGFKPGFTPAYADHPEAEPETLWQGIKRLLGAWARRSTDRYMGHMADRASRTAHRQSYSVATIVLAAKLAKADGPVARAEIDAFKSIFKIPSDEVSDVARIWTAAKRDARGFEPYAHRLAILFAGDKSLQENMMSALIHLAQADGPINDAELRFLQRVAFAFGIDAPTLARLRGKTEAPAEDDPYTILGITPQASDADIKRAWRRLVRVYHPDAIMASGRESDLKHAQQKVAAINTAYETVVRERVRAA